MFPFFKKKEPVKAPEPDVIHEDGGICIANRWWFEPEIGELSFNMTDSSKHRSSVISIVGSHGTGKNFTSKLILYRLCKEGAQATVLVSGLSRQKYGYMCDLLGGKTVFLGENAHINLFEIRKPNEDRCKGSVLERKIRELLAVFKTLMPGIIPKQTALLDMMLHEVYKKKGITLDNASLFVEGTNQYKEFPTIEDLYMTIKLSKVKELEEFADRLSLFVDGPYGWFNYKTDIDWDSPFLVLDFMEYKGKINKDNSAKEFMMAYCFEILSERMQNDADKKAILLCDVFFGESQDVMKYGPYMLEQDTTLGWSKYICQNAMLNNCTVISATSVFNYDEDLAFLHEIMLDADVQVYHHIWSHLVPEVAKACHLTKKQAELISDLTIAQVYILADGKFIWGRVDASEEEYKTLTEYPPDIRVYGRDWQ